MAMSKLACLGVILTLFSCSGGTEQVYMQPVDKGWSKAQPKVFDFELKDAQYPKNIIFVVRNNNDYPYSNLRLISTLEKIGGSAAKPDTLNYVLAEPGGKWLGSGFGQTKETLFQYRMDYKFPAAGRYRIRVIQAMRRDRLPGIEDFGIKIENAKP